jgi:ketosteroid isomerase-like protein
MSQEKIEIVRSIFEALNRRDWDTAWGYQAPDVEFTTPPRGPNAGTYRGREELRGFWQELFTAFDAWTSEPEEFIESGDQLVVIVKTRMRPVRFVRRTSSSICPTACSTRRRIGVTRASDASMPR